MQSCILLLILIYVRLTRIIQCARKFTFNAPFDFDKYIQLNKFYLYLPKMPAQQSLPPAPRVERGQDIETLREKAEEFFFTEFI